MTKFSEFFQEMALSDIQKIGKWDDTKNRHGYDKQSIGILKSPEGWEKLKKTFNRINIADFNLYFVKDTNAWKSREFGKVYPDEVQKLTGLDLRKQPDYNPDAITVIFTNNSAAEKVPLTPWTVAHRIGHSINAAMRRRGRDGEYELLEGKVESAIDKILRNCYGIQGEELLQNKLSRSGSIVRDLVENIGTFRSARMKKLPRTYEFMFECFAQFLLSNGNIKFNDLPKFLKTSNKKAWGNPVGYNKRLIVDDSTAEDYLRELEYSLINLFDYMLESRHGDMMIM